MKNIDFTDFFNVFLSGATIKVHFIGVGILEIPDTQTIIAAKEEIRKNPPSAA